MPYGGSFEEVVFGVDVERDEAAMKKMVDAC